jgi:hypothetical protein
MRCLVTVDKHVVEEMISSLSLDNNRTVAGEVFWLVRPRLYISRPEVRVVSSSVE